MKCDNLFGMEVVLKILLITSFGFSPVLRCPKISSISDIFTIPTSGYRIWKVTYEEDIIGNVSDGSYISFGQHSQSNRTTWSKMLVSEILRIINFLRKHLSEVPLKRSLGFSGYPLGWNPTFRIPRSPLILCKMSLMYPTWTRRRTSGFSLEPGLDSPDASSLKQPTFESWRLSSSEHNSKNIALPTVLVIQSLVPLFFLKLHRENGQNTCSVLHW